MMEQTGIIDLNKNPFAIKSWIDQGYGLTPQRGDLLSSILYKTLSDISVIPINEGKYVAFVAIRWGLAEIINGNYCLQKNGITIKNMMTMDNEVS